MVKQKQLGDTYFMEFLERHEVRDDGVYECSRESSLIDLWSFKFSCTIL